METSIPLYRDLLIKEFEERKKNDPTYSLFTYAASLGVAARTLSQILKGSQIPSLVLGAKLARALTLDPSLRVSFFDSILRIKNAEFIEDQMVTQKGWMG